MASLIPGYEYDIFISYRQKDNKYDGWVSEFVDNLKKELEATFKEEISVYFDINPHDGLLETHSVDKSLEGKLKCLIFIPVISQTYCDPGSFAWQHEFVAFNKMAKEDQFGRDIRLAGGNVAGRILPIKIHDLDPEDKELLENELGGVLRAIEFIYREPGVNRPLKPNDDPKDNLNKTNYRNQVNKVANAVKEIITALRKNDKKDTKISPRAAGSKPEPHNNLKPKIILAAAIALSLALAGYFLIPKLLRPSRPVERSIAVLPFINDSPDQENTYFINGLMDEILSNLQDIKELRVLSRTSTDQYRDISRPTIPEIAKKLNVNYVVEGSGQKYGNKFRLRVQLIAAENERHLWGKSFTREIKDASDIFSIQSQIAQSIASELNVTMSPEEKLLIEKTPSKNLDAYYFYQKGREESKKYWKDESNKIAVRTAEGLYRKAIASDSTFALAYLGLGDVYFNKHQYDSFTSENYLDSLLILTDLALSYDDHLAEAYKFKGDYYYIKGNTGEAIRQYDKMFKYSNVANGDAALMVYALDNEYRDYVKAIELTEKAISLERGEYLPYLIRQLAKIYGWAGFPEKEKENYDKAFKLDGDSNKYNLSLADRELSNRNYKLSIELYKKCYERDSSSSYILQQLANSYFNLGQLKESLDYVKKIEWRASGDNPSMFRGMRSIGFIYWQTGNKKEAIKLFDKQKRIGEESIRIDNYYKKDAPWDLAAVYAFTGERDKAYENLRIVSGFHVPPPWIVEGIKDDPMFNGIRNDLEFQTIAKEIEAKYQAEHERVRKWLEENGKL